MICCKIAWFSFVKVIHDLDPSMSATFIQDKRNPFVLSEPKVALSTACMSESKYEWIARGPAFT